MPAGNLPPLVTYLSDKKNQIADDFGKKHEFAHNWLKQKGLDLASIREHSAKMLAGATLGGALLLSSPQLAMLVQPQTAVVRLMQYFKDFVVFLQNIKNSKLSTSMEDSIVQNIKKFFNVNTVFELDHNRLPTNMGLMGLEQHLYRFPGDTLDKHTAFLEAGIAPGLGAFGYFSDKDKDYSQIEEQERYYIVLQTFQISNWNQDHQTLKDWYKFRKFLVINPANGKAVVASLGDSGPAVWTGKQFGGSPEVMATLGYYPQQTKGEVLVLFIDDPGNKIPLGPIFPKK